MVRLIFLTQESFLGHLRASWKGIAQRRQYLSITSTSKLTRGAKLDQGHFEVYLQCTLSIFVYTSSPKLLGECPLLAKYSLLTVIIQYINKITERISVLE